MNPLQMLMQLMNSGNPQAMIQQVLSRNPQVNAVLNQQRQSGMSMEQFVRQYAQQNNIDINPMVQFLQNRTIK